MTHPDVQEWLDRYIEAWASNDSETIGNLFSHDAKYSYRPWENDEVTVEGREAIVASWQRHTDDPSGWEAHYEPYAVDGDRAVAVGQTRYLATDEHAEKRYHNAFLLVFDDEGRCSSFHEFWVLHKDPAPA